MPHEDGGAYAPVVATVSLGGTLCLDIVHKATVVEDPNTGDNSTESGDNDVGLEDNIKYTIPTRILQEPCSLLITTGIAYQDYMHGIASIEVDENLSSETVANWGLLAEPNVFEDLGGKNLRGTRTSLTYRDVLKVSSAASKVFGGLQKR